MNKDILNKILDNLTLIEELTLEWCESSDIELSTRASNINNKAHEIKKDLNKLDNESFN